MSIDRQFDVDMNANVVSLDDQRKLRQQRDEQDAHVEMVAEPVCEGGVCTLNWSPKKKTAAA